MNDDNIESQNDGLSEKVSHLSKMLVKAFHYAGEDPDTFLQNARKTTEAICRFIHLKELGEPKKRMMLNDYLRALTSNKVIPDRIGILMGTIQTYGNYGAHAQDDFSESTQDWITPCQTALASLTNWFFLEYLQGDVPDELMAPISEHADKKESKGQKSDLTTRKKSNTPVVILAVLVLVVVVGGYYFMKGDGKEQQEQIANHVDTSITTTEDDQKLTEELTGKLNEITIDPNAKRIAIIYFENSSDDRSLDKLRKGLADMMISDLSKLKMLSVVERDQLEAILKEQDMSNSNRFDESTAAEIGKLLGAEHILTGGYFELMGSLRIDAKIIDVETGKILKSEGVDGPSTDFFKLEKQLVRKIVSGLNIDLSDEDDKSLEPTAGHSVSYQTSLEFSETLELIDSGETAKAIEGLENIIKENPDFEPAIKALDKLKVSA